MNGRVLLVWVVVIGTGLAASSFEPTCNLEINVADTGGYPLSGVRVSVDAAVLFDTRSVMTDTTGRVELIGLVPGDYRLELDREGYQWLEVENIHCPPEGALRMWPVLEAVVGEEVVIVPSGPLVDAGSLEVGWWLDREELDPLPSSLVGGADEWVGEGKAAESGIRVGMPASGRQWQGKYLAATGVGDQPPSRVVPRTPTAQWRGEAGFEAGRGAIASPTGTRGAVSTLNSDGRFVAAFGGGLGGDRARLFVSLEGETGRSTSEAEFGGSNTAGFVDRRHVFGRRVALADAAVRWQGAARQTLGLRFRGAVFDDEAGASTLFAIKSSPLSLFGRRVSAGEVIGDWSVVLSDVAVVRVELGGVRRSACLRPEFDGRVAQDQTTDGSFSDGFGNGIWDGGGGVARVDDVRKQVTVEGSLEWAAGNTHRLAVGSAWSENRREVSVDAVDRGRRLYFLNGGGSRVDELAAASPATGVGRRAALSVRDVWRVARDLTLTFGVGLADRDFSGGDDRSGYRLGPLDTPAFDLGAVWDFEGLGRSRAWVHWSRSRPDLDEVIKLRLSGALDIDSELDPGDGSAAELRTPGAVQVDAHLAPSVENEVAFGLEYEVLANIGAGLAGVNRRVSGAVATLSEDGGLSYVVGTPTGPQWGDGLASDRWHASAWLRKRLANSWQAAVTVQWSRARGTWAGPAAADYAAVDREYLRDVVVPDALVNALGPLPDERPWRVEILGSWTLGAGPVLGGRIGYASGRPVSKLGALSGGFGLDRRFVEDRGSAGRTPELWDADVVCSWPFQVAAGVLVIRLEVRNLLNSQEAVTVDQRWTLLDEEQAAGLDPNAQRTPGTWGEALENRKPLEARIGVTYRW